MRFNVCFAALAATLVATPAFAATFPTDTANATAKGTVLLNHSLTNKTALDFGIVTVDSTGGTVSVSASGSPSRTFGGGVTLLPSTFSAAEFDGLAAPVENVVLTLNPPLGGIIKDAAGDQLTVSNMYVDQANNMNRTADAAGTFTVYVGGDFTLIGNQPSGVYSGQFSLTAQYQ